MSLLPLAFGTEEYEFGEFGSVESYMRGLALGLTAVSPGGGLNAQANSLVSRVLQASAVNVNGLINATPLSPSTVQIRLGAMCQMANDRMMIARSFNGFFALVVPTAYAGPVELVAKPIFRDPKTGRHIGGTPPSTIEREVRGEFCTFGLVLQAGCAYGAEPSQANATTGEDDWFAFLRRIRRNEYDVLRCVGIREPKMKPAAGRRDDAMCDGDKAALVDSFPASNKAPSFLLGPLVSEVNRVGLKVRGATTFIELPPAAGQ